MSNREKFARSAPSSQARSRRTLACSFAVSLIIAVVMMLSLTGPAVDAATCTSSATGTAWNDPAGWSCGAGPSTYPGEFAGDIASLGPAKTVTTTIPNAVTLSGGFAGNIAVAAGGTLTLQASSVLTSGNIAINGGTLIIGSGTFTPGCPVTLTTGQLTLSSGANFSTPGNFFTFQGGTVAGPGTLTNTAATMPFNGTGAGMILDNGAIIQNNATIDYTSTSNTLLLKNGSHVKVNSGGIFDILGTAQLLGDTSGASIDVLSGGILSFSANTSGQIQARVNNDGTVSSQIATLQLTGGGTHSGAWVPQSPGANFTFSGTQKFTGGTFNVQTSSPGYTFTGTSSSFDIASNISIPGFKWDGGTITSSASGVLTLPSDSVFDATANPLALNSGVVIGGPLAPGSADCTYTTGTSTALTLNGQITVTNAGTNSSFFNWNTSLSGFIGSMAGAGTMSVGSLGFVQSTGTVSMSPSLNVTASGSNASVSGVLNLLGGGSVSAGNVFFSGSTVNVAGGTFTVADAPMLSGGTLKVGGGNLSFSAASSNLPAALDLESGSVNFLAASIDLQPSQLIWNGGAFASAFASDSVTINSGGNTTMPAPVGIAVLNNVAFNNNGTFYFNSPSFGLALQNNAMFNNNGTFDANDGAIAGDATTAFKNGVTQPGFVSKSAGTLTQFNIKFMQNFSSSMVDVISSPSGTIKFAGGGAAGTGTFLNPSNATNTIDFVGPVFLLDGATLSSGGTGMFRVLTGGTVNVSGPINLATTLQNAGTVGYTTASPANVAPGVIISNLAAGLFDIQTDASLLGSSTIFNNAGLLKKSAGSGITQFFPAINNSGTVQAFTGGIDFAGGFTQTAGVTTVGPGAIKVGGGTGTMNINGGILNGNGTVAGNVVNSAGAVNPGTSPGTLTVAGNYTQTSPGVLNLEIGGTSPGAYDVFNVTGTASLGGTLNVTTLSPYTPAGGQSFTMMTYGSKGGAFSPISLPTGGFSTVFSSTSMAVVVTQADIIAIQSAAASPINSGQTAVFNVTVTNNGPQQATAVSLTDTFTGGTLFSVTPSQGTCSGTTSINCSLGTLTSGASATVQVKLTPTGSSVQNQASASATEFDPSLSNNTATPATVSVTSGSDLALTVSHTPDPVNLGDTTKFVFIISNAGPSMASTFSLSITGSGGTIVSALPDLMSCTATSTVVNCSGSSLAAGANQAVVVTFSPTATTGVSMTGTVSSPTDSLTSNNSVTQSVNVRAGADLRVTKSGPTSANAGDPVTYTISVVNNGPDTATGVTLSDPTVSGLTLKSVSGGCTAFPCSVAYLSLGDTLSVTAAYTVNTNATGTLTNVATVTSSSADPHPDNNSASANTTITGCGATPPVLRSPLGSTVVLSPVTFTWDASVPAATQYEVFVVQGGTPKSVGITTATSLSGISIATGPVTWYVVATIPNCATVTSSTGTGNACNVPAAPTPSVVANAASGQTFSVLWDSVADATSYQIQEATDAAFTNPTQTSVTTTSATFTHTATTSAQPFFYRVRGIGPCGTGSFSQSVRVVILPQQTGSAVGTIVPAGSTTNVIQNVFIPGEPGASFGFTATVDKPWLSVSPSTGILPPAGITLAILADPTTLPNGTFTGTVIVTLTPLTASAGAHTQGTTTVSVPVSVSLVTPVSPTTKTSTAANALLIPSVGHLDGINSQWQSDIRLANVGFSKQQYTLTFIPSGATGAGVASGVKSTNITVDAGATTALDDVVRNWYGVGSLGEASNGVLEIKSLSGGQDGPGTSITTVASSRTYNVSSQGTLGQYIPAIPFANFVGKAAGSGLATILSLQQIQQSSAYRTNIGVVEGAGSAANVTLSVYDGVGKKLTDFAMSLAPYQQVQLNSFLASQNIALNDGRVEVKVTDGGGKVTAYASVIDNATNDPFLVSAVPVGGSQSDRYVLPGVAALNTGTANWQTDMRIFSSGAAPQNATLTLYPLGGGTPLTATTQVNPGEVKTLNSVVQSLFNQDNLGGALHVVTSTLSNLVVTGRTYNQTATGTYGQFVPAVTASDAASLGGRSLNLLQVEDSPRYRTNLGIAEVSGKPATVQIMVFLPDSKVTPKIEIPLAAYQYMQIPIIQSMGLGNVYNARINIQVTGGDGKVASYASVIDQNTQDPTYVPAQ